MTNAAPRLVAGRYRLESVLGRGTMGTVWSARDEVLGRPVAIKELLLPPGISETEADALRERSMREARAIAALSHPNVVTLYDVAREGSAPFVVMELVASHSLAELTRDGGLPHQQVAAIGSAVAAALQAAHAAGITHRDVKPGNVLVAHDGQIKLTDFGIARNPADQTLTATGLMLGSPAYIAPEIAAGGPVNPASDLWGLGATLFAAIEGRPPYDAGTAMATVAAVVQGEVPRASCSGPLAEVISGLMVKDPARRIPLSRVRQMLGPPPAPADPAPADQPTQPHIVIAPEAGITDAGIPVSGIPDTGTAETPERSRQRSVQLAADPGPLPFTPAKGAARATTHRRQRAGPGRPAGPGRRVALWALVVLLFLATAMTSFALARITSGHPVLPTLKTPAMPSRGPDDVALASRVLQVGGPDGTRPVQVTLSVPQGWPEFREQRTLGTTSATVLRFVSPDGSEAIAIERVTGALPARLDPYLTNYLRRLAQGLPQLVETQRQQGSAGTLDATFRTQEGGELRRTTYLRLVPSKAEVWVISVTVPTEREGAGRTKLFEPVVASFTP